MWLREAVMAYGEGEAAKEIFDNPKIERGLKRLSGYESIARGETEESVYIYFTNESGARLAVKLLEKMIPGPNYEYYEEDGMFVIAVTDNINEDHMPGPPYEYDNISEPYSIEVGDFVKNTNPSCPHHGSQGIVNKLITMPDDVGTLIKYTVTNSGDTFKPGQALTKTSDQLEPIED
jgi:hypothetical protein